MSTLNLKYRQLKAFMLAMEKGSFKAAADALAVTQPSFSVLIKELEIDTGVLLFDRSAKRCLPTKLGVAFYSQILGPLSNLEDAYRHVKSIGTGTEGTLALAAPPSIASDVLADRLSSFRKRFPRVKITLMEGKHDQVVMAVRQAEVEFGVGSMLHEDPELTFEPLFKDRLMIVAPPGHPVLRMRPTWKSLDRFDLVLLSGGPAEHGLRISQVRPSKILEVQQLATALAMVRYGMGVSVLPSATIPSGEGLEFVPMEGRLGLRQIGLIQKKHAHLSAVAKAFIESLREAVASR